MSGVDGRYIDDGTIPSTALDSNAASDVLSTKLLASRSAILALSTPTGQSVINIDTEIRAAAANATPRGTLSAGIGIYTGSITGATDPKIARIRLTGTDNGVDDGTGDDVYGQITIVSGVYYVTFFKQSGLPHSFSVATDIDILFVEIFTLNDLPVDAALRSLIGGLVDQTSSNTALQALGAITDHLDGGASKHDADEIDYERSAQDKSTIFSTSAEGALTELDDGKLPLLSANTISQLNVDLANAPAVITGYTLQDQDLVLLTNQDATSENGLYVWTSGSPNTLTRANSLNKVSQFKPGITVQILGGDRSGTSWVLTDPVVLLGTNDVLFSSSAVEAEGLLELDVSPVNAVRVSINPSERTLSDGTRLTTDMALSELFFTGRDLDFATGQIYPFEGTVATGDTFPTTSGTPGNYKWASVALVANALNAVDQMEPSIVVRYGVEGASPSLATRPSFPPGKPLGLVLIQFNGSGAASAFTKSSISRIAVAAGSAAEFSAIQESAVGAVNGVNTSFSTTNAPVSKESLLVFVDNILLEETEYSLSGSLVTLNSAPLPGQSVYFRYYVDTFNVGGGGGSSVDLTNIDVDISPDANGSHSVGTGTRGFSAVFLKDTQNSNVYRLEVANGTLQAVLVGS